MPNWGKQTNLLRKAETLDERIEIIKTWANELDHVKLTKYLRSSFRTLNNPKRYKYYMQPNTVTHEKFLTFLIILHLMCRRAHDKEYVNHAVSTLLINRSKEWLTLYYIFKVYELKEDELYNIKIAISPDEVNDLKDNAATGGYEFAGFSFYDHNDLIKECLKRMKKGTLESSDNPKRDYNQLMLENQELKTELKRLRKKKGAADVKGATCGDLIAETYVRRSMQEEPVKVKKHKKKKHAILLDTW